MRRNERNDSSIPTMNKSISTPSSASTSTWSRVFTTASADGPSNTPARM